MKKMTLGLGAATLATPALAHGGATLHVHGSDMVIVAVLAAAAVIGAVVMLFTAR